MELGRNDLLHHQRRNAHGQLDKVHRGIKVAGDRDLKAIAVASGYTNSAVASATYTINLTAQSFSVVVSPASLTVQAGRVEGHYNGDAAERIYSAVSLSCSDVLQGRRAASLRPA